MTDFLIGIVIGALLAYSLSGIFKKRGQVSMRGVSLELPKSVYQAISEAGAPFEWNALKTIKKVIKLGLLALLLYGKLEGGVYVLDNLKTPMLVELEDTESGDTEDLGPFKDFIDNLDL